MSDEKTENKKGGVVIALRSLAILVMLLSTALFVAMLLTGSEMNFAFALTAVIWLPVLIIGLVIWIVNIAKLFSKQRCKYNLLIVIWGAVNVLLMAGSVLQERHNEEQVDAEHLIAHYEANEAELWDLVEYARSAMDSGTWMCLEFDGRKVEMFHTATTDGIVQNRWSEYRKPSLDPDTIGPYIGLTHNEVEGIRQRLEKAGCISIELTNYGNAASVPHYGKTLPIDEVDFVTIGRKRHSMSAYYYVLFRHPMSDSTWNRMLRDDIVRIPICDTMALEYGSPAFGSIDYPQRDAIIKRLGIKLKGVNDQTGQTL